MHKRSVWVAAGLIGLMLFPVVMVARQYRRSTGKSAASQFTTATPIKHLVVIFDENSSFDHYFGTYPNAKNPPGEPPFHALPGTPTVNGLTNALLTHNPNSANPFRLGRSQNETCDNDNHYTDEQSAYDGGLLDKFATILSAKGSGCIPNLSMGYYDGNTVTALWNYAQHYSMSDNFFASEFGTTVMGHLNLVSGQTHGATPASITGKVVDGTLIGNADPTDDMCSTGSTITMSGQNIGNLLNAKGTTWGWFSGGWVSKGNSDDEPVCNSGYNPHYMPFQFYASTANPDHLPPSSVAAIGKTDQANHEYNLNDFWKALDNGNLPAVSFLKAPSDQTGHPSTSGPLAEQAFLVDTINRLQESPQWKDMAIIITYDDSDGWYDHVMPPILNPSDDPAHDNLLGSTGLCGTPANGAYEDRCGYGPRLPFLVISPFAKKNFVSHTLADQSSIIHFIEDNWGTGRIGDQSFDAYSGSILNMFDFRGSGTENAAFGRMLILDPSTGEPISAGQ